MKLRAQTSDGKFPKGIINVGAMATYRSADRSIVMESQNEKEVGKNNFILCYYIANGKIHRSQQCSDSNTGLCLLRGSI
jgi:hypothetical protein